MSKSVTKGILKWQEINRSVICLEARTFYSSSFNYHDPTLRAVDNPLWNTQEVCPLAYHDGLTLSSLQEEIVPESLAAEYVGKSS